MPGIGFSIGEDRLVMTIEERLDAASLSPLDLYVVPMGVEAVRHAALLARDLRRAGVVVEVSTDAKVKRAMELANKLNARYALLLGEDEIAGGVYALKNMADAQQRNVTRDELFAALANP